MSHPVPIRPRLSARLLSACFAAVSASAGAPDGGPTNAHVRPPEVELRGRVICLPEEMHRTYQTDLPTRHEHLWGFKTTNGTCYTLLQTKLSEALFLDARLREKELLLKGRVFPQTHIFDVAHLRSIKNGLVHELYYYCDVCDIESVTPRECFCCQGPVELREKPK
jgi:hypothetical protein